MRTTDAGIALIKEFEGLGLSAYQDGAGLWTIGWGHRGSEAFPGNVISENDADEIFLSDVAETEHLILSSLTIPVNDNELSALVSFVFNLGITRFRNSTLILHLEGGDMDDAAEEFLKWCYEGDKISQGLLRRRQAEMDLFLSPPNPEIAGVTA